MHAEIFEGKPDPKTGQRWRWHFKVGRKVTAQGEAHDSKSKAIRAAQGVVRAVVKARNSHEAVEFTRTAQADGSVWIEWS